MKLLDASGGSTKGIGIYNAWKVAVVENGYKPDVISGVSVSALISVPFSLGKYAELDKLFSNFTLDTIFTKSPINKRGKITRRAAFRALLGFSSLGKMGQLEKVLRKLVTKSDFIRYQADKKYPDCYVLAIDFKTTKRVLVNLKTVDTYEDYIKYTVASATIPVYAEGVKWKDMILYDGGVRDHSIGYYICQTLDITECISVWSRPKKPKAGEEKEELLSDSSWCDDNIVDVAERALEILQLDNSEQDEDKLEEVCYRKNIKLRSIHLPKVLTSIYDTDRKRLDKLKLLSIEKAKSVLK
jgi:hypothetical protein